MTSSTEYPDTLSFTIQPNPILNPNFTKVQPHETNNNVLGGRDCIEIIYKDLIASDTLLVYVFDAQVLESTSWDTVISQHLILKRYDLSLDDLELSNWAITYP